MGCNAGWRGESSRHSLAARGVKTGSRPLVNRVPLSSARIAPRRASTEQFSLYQRGKVQGFMHRLFDKKRKEHPDKAAQIDAAKAEISGIRSEKDVESFMSRHRVLVDALGITMVIGAIGMLVPGVVMPVMVMAEEGLTAAGGNWAGNLVARGMNITGITAGIEGLRRYALDVKERRILRKLAKEKERAARVREAEDVAIIEESKGKLFGLFSKGVKA